MIKKSFCHIDGISKNTEELLWNNGIENWDEFLEKMNRIHFLPKGKIEKIRTGVLFSRDYLNENNLSYFVDKLPTKEHYRLVNCGKIGFVDIETTGLSKWSDEITMIGIYDGEEVRSYVLGQDLDEAIDHLKKFDIIVTFNGKCFDMPFIEYKYKEKFDIVHLDLRFMMADIGFKGGLKKIEKEVGLTRDDEVAEVDGFEAVRLWRRYKRGDEDALRKLLIYNKEDIVNLKTLLEFYLEKKGLVKENDEVKELVEMVC